MSSATTRCSWRPFNFLYPVERPLSRCASPRAFAVAFAIAALNPGPFVTTHAQCFEQNTCFFSLVEKMELHAGQVIVFMNPGFAARLHAIPQYVRALDGFEKNTPPQCLHTLLRCSSGARFTLSSPTTFQDHTESRSPPRAPPTWRARRPAARSSGRAASSRASCSC